MYGSSDADDCSKRSNLREQTPDVSCQINISIIETLQEDMHLYRSTLNKEYVGKNHSSRVNLKGQEHIVSLSSKVEETFVKKESPKCSKCDVIFPTMLDVQRHQLLDAEKCLIFKKYITKSKDEEIGDSFKQIGDHHEDISWGQNESFESMPLILSCMTSDPRILGEDFPVSFGKPSKEFEPGTSDIKIEVIADDETKESCLLPEDNCKHSNRNDSPSCEFDGISRKESQSLSFVYNNENYPLLMEEDLLSAAKVNEPVSGTSDIKIEIIADDETYDSCPLTEGNNKLSGKNDSSSDEIDSISGKESQSISFVFNTENYPLLMEGDILSATVKELVLDTTDIKIEVITDDERNDSCLLTDCNYDLSGKNELENASNSLKSKDHQDSAEKNIASDVTLSDKVLNCNSIDRKVSQVSPSSFVLDQNYNSSDRLRIQAMLENMKSNQLKAPLLEESQYNVISLSEHQETTPKRRKIEDVSIHENVQHKKIDDYLSERSNLGDQKRSEKNSNQSQVDVTNITRIDEENALIHFRCPLCDKKFSSLGILNRHKTVHSGEMPFSCLVCNKCFRRKDGLASHQKNAQKLSCQMCKLPFCNYVDLKMHEKSHSARKLHFCYICDIGFYENSKLQRHKKSKGHIDNFSKRCYFGDEIKSKKKSDQSQLDMASTTRIDKENTPSHSQRPMYKNISSLGILNRHKTSHRGKMPFSCSVCNKCFRRRGGLVSHQKNALNLSCQMCKQAFCKFFDLKMHERCHSARKVHFCYICDIGFYVKSKLQRHEKSKGHIDASKTTENCSFASDLSADYGNKKNRNIEQDGPWLSAESQKASNFGKVQDRSKLLNMKDQTHGNAPNVIENVSKNQDKCKILNNHIEAHGLQKVKIYQCDKCHRRFKSYKMYLKHQNNHKAYKHKCNLCDKLFSKRRSLENHQKICQDTLKTTDNRYSASDLSADNGNKKNRNIGQNCPRLSAESLKASQKEESVSNLRKVQNGSKSLKIKKDKKHGNSSDVLENMPTTHDKYNYKILSNINEAHHSKEVKTYQCDKCHRHFKSFKMYLKHQNNHKAYKHKCNLCDKLFSKRRLLENHKKKCQANSSCMFGSTTSTEYSIKNPKHFVNDDSNCENVNVKNISKQSDVNSSLNTNSTIRELSQISMNKETQNDTDLSKNIRSNMVESRTINSGESKKCEECGKVFSSLSSLRNHKTVHSGIRPFSCLWCHASFRRKDTLGKHKKKGRKLSCHLCRKRFCNGSNLRRHEATEHSHIEAHFKRKQARSGKGSSAKVSNTASSETSIKDSLKRTLLKGKNELGYPAKLMNLRYRVLKSKEYQFKCEMCEKSYASESSLKRHKRLNHYCKPTYCSELQTTETEEINADNNPMKAGGIIRNGQYGSYKKDTITTCPDQLPVSECSPVVPTVISEGGSSLKKNSRVCGDCGKTFASWSSLKKHLIIHTGLKPFSCTWCKYRFGRKDHLLKHRRRAVNLCCDKCNNNFCSGKMLHKHVLKQHDKKETTYLDKSNCMSGGTISSKYPVKNPEPIESKKIDCEYVSIEPIAKQSTRELEVTSLPKSDSVIRGSSQISKNKESQIPADLSKNIRSNMVVSHSINSSISKKCEECGKVFSSLSSLRSHKTIHSGIKPFACLWCHASFRRKDTLIKHKRPARKLSCRLCRKQFCNGSKLRKHEATEHSHRQSNVYVQKKAKIHQVDPGKHLNRNSGTDLKSHKKCPSLLDKLNHRNSFLEKNSATDTVNEVDISNEYAVVKGHGIILSETKPVQKKTGMPVQDSVQYSSKHNYIDEKESCNRERHYDSQNEECEYVDSMLHEKETSISFDVRAVTMGDTLKIDKISSVKSCVPNINEKASVVKEDLNTVCAAIKQSSGRTGRKYKCEKCGYLSDKRIRYVKHMASHTVETPYQCQVCHRYFPYLKVLNYHRHVHKDKPYNCELCSKSFSQASYLRKHVSKVHKAKTDEKIPVPAVGGGLINSEKEISERHNGIDSSLTSLKNILGRDETDIHFEKELSELDEGKVKVSGNNINKANLDILSGTVLEEERNLNKKQPLAKTDFYNGRKCGEGFSIPPNLSRHEIHDECSSAFHRAQSNKAFSSNLELRVHEAVRAEHEYYECTTCNKQFAQISSLRKHQTLLNHKGGSANNIIHIYQKENVSANSRKNRKEFGVPIDNQRKENKDGSNGHEREVSVAEDHQQSEEIKNKSPRRKHFTNRTFLLQRKRAEKDERDKKSCVKEDVTKTKDDKLKLNTQSIPKPYVCKICCKGFLYASDLRRHEAFHINVVTNTDVALRPYKCKKCNRRFSLRTKFLCHQKRHFAMNCNVIVKPLRTRFT